MKCKDCRGKNCFGYCDQNGGCSVLSNTNFKNDTCSFFKEKDRADWEADQCKRAILEHTYNIDQSAYPGPGNWRAIHI